MSAQPIVSSIADTTTVASAVDCSAAIAQATAYSPEAVVVMGVCFILGSLVTTLCLLFLDGIRVALRNSEPSPDDFSSDE